MKNFSMIAIVVAAGLTWLGAQTVERPAGEDSRSLGAARTRDLAATMQQIQAQERKYQAARQAAQSHPDDLRAQAIEAGEHVTLLNLLLTREMVEIKYLELGAKAASDLADRLAAGTRDQALETQISDLSGQLAESKTRLRELLQTAQQSQDADAQQRLGDAVARTEALQSSLELFERAKQREEDAQKDRDGRVARLRAAAADAERAAASHSYKELAIKATMAARMVDLHVAGEELQTRDVQAAVKTMIGGAGDDALENKYVLHPAPTNQTGTIEDRARRLLGDDDSQTPAPSNPDSGKPQQ